MVVPKASLKKKSPSLLRYFFTLPAPAKCAAAKIPDSVTSTLLIFVPTKRLISLRSIHLFLEVLAIKAFSCKAALAKKACVL